MDATQLLVMCVILAAAGAVQGLSGFGFGLLSVGLLALVWPDAKTATILPLLPNIVICGYVLWTCRRHVPFSRLKWFVPASVVGVPLGVLALREIDVIYVHVGIAALLIFSGLHALLRRTRGRAWHRLWAGLPLGLCSGCLGGAFNTGGPPAIAFLSNQSLDRFALVSGLQAVFLINALVRVGSLVGAGMLTARLAAISAIGVVGALAGVTAGLFILRRVSERGIQNAVKVAQLLLGVVYLGRVWLRM